MTMRQLFWQAALGGFLLGWGVGGLTMWARLP